tara:strand:+ start:43 stop:426 length:384 start_codon:yes stop_codon:yes gene_type:complete
MHLINNGDIMKQFVYEAWTSVMDMEKNPLRHIPDLQVRHMILQILAWMWATTFALWMGSIYAFGISTLAHLFVIAAIVFTVGTFETAKRRPTFFLKRGYHTPSRARNMWFNGKKIKLDENDKGGEHE